jgi:cysteine synthase A
MDDSILDALGSPLVRVDSPPGTTVAAKVESKNPGGSAKDRPALYMVEAAERAGRIEPGDALVEPTSGNTGIGLAVVGAAKGYDVTLVMPASQSPERRRLMEAYGATIELVEGGIPEAKARADELEAAGAVQLRQFENEANPRAHYETTAGEVLDQLDGRTPDALVAGVGTGGTLSGLGRRLREEFPAMEVVAVEPVDSAVLSGDRPSEHEFQGMGPGFVSPNLDTSLLTGVERVAIEEAEAECRRLAREEGILVGQSSGGSNVAAKRVAERLARGDPPAEPFDPDAVRPEARYDESGGGASGDGRAGDAGDGEGDGDAEEDGDGSPDAHPDRDPDATGAASDGGRASEGDVLVLTVFWDSGERYMSTGLFDD